MNLFFLHWNVRKSAKWHFDRHVVKLIIEIAQLLSATHHVLQPEVAAALAADKRIYRLAQRNHPLSIWMREHINNYKFGCEMGLALCAEYSARYEKRTHKTEAVLNFLKVTPPKASLFLRHDIDERELVGPHRVIDPPQVVPDECLTPGDVIEAYRKYYCHDMKAHLRSWKEPGERPPWFPESLALKKKAAVKRVKSVDVDESEQPKKRAKKAKKEKKEKEAEKKSEKMKTKRMSTRHSLDKKAKKTVKA